MILYRPKRILVQEQSWQDAATQQILDKLPGMEIQTIREVDTRLVELQYEANSPRHGTDTLILMHYPGKFMKNCQGSGAEICCNYFIVSYAWNCHLECAYCVLQSYLNTSALMVCTNIDDLLAEVRERLGKAPDCIFRIGTGELADSLALDSITCYSKKLVPFFGSLPNGILELKTKTDQIGNLEGLDHRGHTVVSWSMNSRRICRTEELKAPGFEQRLAAALRCQDWGYKLGFHFDPMIYYEGWEDDYREVVEEIFKTVNQTQVAWVSLGALRFTPRLRDLVRKRFPKSTMPYGEFVPGHHGKLRYFRPIREEMYRKMRSWIHEKAPGVLVYLCMESRVVWKHSFDEIPRDATDLSNSMDLAVLRGCN